jgi:hypothetical protein
VYEASRVIALRSNACCYAANLFPHLTFCILTGEASCEQNLVSYSPTPDPAGRRAGRAAPTFSRRGSGHLEGLNYENLCAPLLINITRSAFSASAPKIAVIIYDGSDVAAPAFNREQHFRRQRHVEDEPRYG